QGVTALMDIETGPDGALWYLQGGGYTNATLKRLVGPGAAPPPTTPPAPATPVPSPTTPAGGPPPSIPGSGSPTLPGPGQTGNAIFLDYWNSHGGLTQQGYPISGLLTEVSDLNGQTYTVQYFERAVFEYHPENQPPYNVLLSQLGTFRYHQKYPA